MSEFLKKHPFIAKIIENLLSELVVNFIVFLIMKFFGL